MRVHNVIRTYRAKPDWAGETAVVLGNGTSLIGRDLSKLNRPGVHTMIANSGVHMFPEAEVMMCSDRNWLREFHADVAKFLGKLIIVTRPEAVIDYDERMRYMRREFIDRARGDYFADDKVLVEGHTSTSTNISLAVMRGASRILLMGIDLKPGPDGRRRAMEDLTEVGDRFVARYERQVRHLTQQSVQVLARGVEVLNCSPPSDLVCYPMAAIEDILP